METSLLNPNYNLANVLPYKGRVEFYPQLFTEAESQFYLQKLIEDIRWKQEPIKIMGKIIQQPRLTAWYGEADKSYRYSGIIMKALPWTSWLLEIKLRIEEKAGIQFTSTLLNYYRSGRDYMGWHRDNEKELGSHPVIGSVSFGVSRKFQFRDYIEKKPVISIVLNAGSALIMKGETNYFWEHRLPKSIKSEESRINLTFRAIQ